MLEKIAADQKVRIVAQTGDAGYSSTTLEAHAHLAPQEFERYFQEAELIVAHAGIGSVLSAQRNRKPIILFPRLAKLGEHRNEHQLATVRQLAGRAGFYSATTEQELSELIRQRATLEMPNVRQSASKVSLIEHLAEFIAG
ncbi:glycosyltransferase [Hydrocarboniphaga sp.]|uniref:glycosyltransferase n=1 Tax=Hydrocarboniphaga sp. TaxID=2033016 RepID=UPI003D13CB7A